jgi:EpsI family protein
MKRNDKLNRQAVVVAAVVASFLMLVFGLGYRVLATRLAAPVNTTPVALAALERFPLQIGGWTGQDIPMDEAVVRATDTDAHINRRYSRHNGLESVWFYVACGVRARDLMTHRPEVCYTGSGWTLTDRRALKLPLNNDGTELPCEVFQFSRGALNTEKVAVLDYYIVDGQYCRDVSLLRSKAWRGSGTVRYVAQVQIVTSLTANLTADSAERIVSDFAVESASPISRLFEGAEEDHRSDKAHSDVNCMFGGTESG